MTTVKQFIDDKTVKIDNQPSPVSRFHEAVSQFQEVVAIPERLREAKSLLTPPQFALCVKLHNLGQSHIFENWDTWVPKHAKKFLAKQLEALDEEYSGGGGLVGYIENARKLLAASAKGLNPLESWKPEVPIGESFTLGTENYKNTEEIGMKQMGSVGFVLVAGGLGERLGYSSIKVGLPTEMTTETRYLHLYIEYILAVQRKYAPAGRKLPLCIMTSRDTHDKTLQLLSYNNYFGMPKSQITIVMQGQGVPALADNNAKFVLEDDDPSKIVTKPHGHGDIHALLYKHGVARQWKQKSIDWLCLFQDTNGLAFHTLPIMLGVSSKLNLIMNSLTVPRKAKQAIGAIAKLKNTETKEVRTINIEYNQLDPMLRANGYPDGDVNDEKTGYSPFPGNINQLLFKIEDYVEILEQTKGFMPEFVNPKYADPEKTIFKKATRLECMMQDFPTVIPAAQSTRVGFTNVEADLCFSPVKNSTFDGTLLQAVGTAPGTAATGEADQYQAFRKILRSIGCHVNEAEPEMYLGIKVVPGPAVVIKPDFALCPREYPARFPTPEKVKISARSTLIVRGAGVKIHSLELSGALIIDVPNDQELEITDLVVKNAGWVRVPVKEQEGTEFIRMRGYKIERRETTVIKSKRDIARAMGKDEFECMIC